MATAQLSSDAQLGFPPKGSLKRVPFPRLIQQIDRNALSGSLYLLSGQTKKVVFFREGRPIFVRSNVLGECLGQILSRQGIITPEQCESTLEAIRKTGKKQGEILVEMGLLSRGNLDHGLRTQLRTKLFDIFGWEDGRYQFKSDPPQLEFGVEIRLSAAGIVVSAILDRFDDERAASQLAQVATKYPFLASPDLDPEGLGLIPEELHFLRCLDGSRSVEEILSSTPEPPVPALRPLLWGLLESGLVEPSARPRPARTAPPAPKLAPDESELEALRAPFGLRHESGEHDATPPPHALPAPPPEPSPEPIPATHSPVPTSTPPPVETAERPSDEDPLSITQTEDPDLLETSTDDRLGQTFDEHLDAPRAELPRPGPTERPEPRRSVRPPVVRRPVARPPAAAEPQPLPTPEPPAAPTTDPIPGPTGHAHDLDALDEAVRSLQFGTTETPAPASNESSSANEISSPTLQFGLEPEDLVGLELVLDPELQWAATLETDEDLAFSSAAELDGGESALDALLSLSPEREELLDLDELEAVDLSPVDLSPVDLGGGTGTQDVPPPPPRTDHDDDPTSADLQSEVLGARHFNDAEAAMAHGDFPQVIALLEAAYEHGFDVAELHAMLAYARFMASEQDDPIIDHALELLDYAQEMDPSLDLVHAYRGAILQALQQPQLAREELDRALELNPYCEFAIQLIDQM